MASLFTVLEAEYKRDIEALQSTLLNNRAESLEHYRYLTGQLRGLTVALNKLKDLENKVNKDSDWEQ